MGGKILKTFKERIHRFGLRRTLVAVLLGRCRGFLNIWIILERELSADFELPEEHRHFVFRQLSYHEALAASEQGIYQLTSDFVEAAFARDDYCFGAFDRNQLVAYLWRSTSVAPVGTHLQLRLDHRPQFYGYKSFVLPAYRGQRLIQSVGRIQDAQFLERGINLALGYVALFNLPSLTSYLRQPDQRKIGYAGFISIGSLTLPFRTKGARAALRLERV